MTSNRAGITTTEIAVMATAAGIGVANIYYNQPLLADMARSLDVTESQVGNLPVLTQAGYGAGLLFLTPLGDKFERKQLILWLQGGLIVVLLATVMTRSLTALCVMGFLTGLFAVAVQVIMPMAAALAGERKGKVVGMVFTGLLIGVLLARVFSGVLARHFGWRSVYGVSAGMMLVMMALVGCFLPRVEPDYRGDYGELLKSTVHQLVRFPALLRVSLMGAFIFGAFCSFWTALTFHLSGPPFYYRSDAIGMFGLVAVAGTLAAPLFGRLADHWHPARTQVFTVGLFLVSILLMQWLPTSLTAFIVATLFLDVGMQATQVGNFAQIYLLDEAAHSRINTAFIATTFVGGAAGTWVGVRCWVMGGWNLVCWQMLAFVAVALILALAGWRGHEGRTPPPAEKLRLRG